MNSSDNGRAIPEGEPILPPAGWYVDPQLQRPRYWDGQRWTEDIAVGPQATATAVSPSKPPRPTWMRVAMTILSWFALTSLGWALEAGAASANPEEPGSGGGLTLMILLPVYAILAPKVSYRWFDCLFLLIPFYNLIWSFTIMWRVVYLPYRDWPPRPHEAVKWVPVAAAPGSSKPLFVSR